MTSADVQIRLRGLIEKSFAKGTAFSDDSDLYALGIVDSLAAAGLLTSLEETFSVTLDDSVIFDERFATLAGLTSIICELRGLS